MKWRLLPAAVRDLKELRAYVAFDNPAAANNVVARLKKAFILISERPNIGRPSSEGPTREWSVPGLPYLIPYRINGDTVEIIRVWHTSRRRPEEW